MSTREAGGEETVTDKLKSNNVIYGDAAHDRDPAHP